MKQEEVAAAFSPVLVQQLRDYYYQRQQQDAAQPTPTPSSRHHPSAQAASAAVDASPLSLYYYSTPSNRDENRPPPQPSSPAPPTGSAALKALADVLPLLKQAAATSSLSAFKAAASLPRSRAADTRPIYDDDDSVAFSNLMPRWVANGAQGAVLPLQQRTPNKPLSSVAFGSGATPSGKGKSTPRRSKGWEGNAAARAATPLIDGRLADGADVLYPDVSPVRKQAPAAVFPRAGSAVKMRQKQDLRPALEPNDALTRKRAASASFLGAPRATSPAARPASAGLAAAPAAVARGGGGGASRSASPPELVQLDPQYEVALRSAPRAAFPRAARFGSGSDDAASSRDTGRSKRGSRDDSNLAASAASSVLDAADAATAGRRFQQQQPLQVGAAVDATLPRKSAAFISSLPRFRDEAAAVTNASQKSVLSQQQQQLNASAAGGSSAKKPRVETPGVAAARDALSRRTPGVSLATPSVREQIREELERKRRLREERERATAAAAAAGKANPDGSGAAPDGADSRSASPHLSPPRDASAAPRTDAVSPPGRHVPGAVSFAPMSPRPASPLPGRPTVGPDLGPGTYKYDEHVLSYVANKPRATFGTAARDLSPFGKRRPDADGDVAHAALSWAKADAAAAADRLKPRSRAAAIRPISAAEKKEEEEERRRRAGGGDGSEAAGDDDEVIELDVRYDLVEPRIRGGAVIRQATLQPQPQHGGDSDAASWSFGQDRDDAEGGEESADPWQMDAALRTRKPAWGFGTGQGHWDMRSAESFASTGRLPGSAAAADGGDQDGDDDIIELQPNYGAVRPKAASGVPDFFRALARFVEPTYRPGISAKSPMVGQYELEGAWRFLQKHVPLVALQRAAERWVSKASASTSAPGGGAGGAGGSGLALPLELLPQVAAAIDAVRPSPARWTITPVHATTRRVPDLRLGYGFGPHLAFDFDLAVVKKKLAGTVPFYLLLGRDDAAAAAAAGASGALALVTAGGSGYHQTLLGPGYYDLSPAFGRTEPRAREFDMSRAPERGLLEQDAPPLESVLEGNRLALEPLAAKDATLPRRPFTAFIADDLGRRPLPGEAPVHGAATTHLGLPDADIDAYLKRHVPQVDMDSGDAHAALVLPGAAGPRADLRGPGAYEVQGVNAVGTDAPAITFAASTAPRFADPGDAAAASGDGDRLVLEPNLDAVRPVPQAAVILPEHAPPADRDAAGRQPSDALYAVDLSAVRSGPPGAPSFEHMQGRDDAAGGAAAGGGRPLDYEVDKLPLTLLSEFRSAPGGPNFDRMRPHEDGDAGGVDGGAADGTRLDLCPEAAREYLRGRGGAAAPDMQHGDGHGDMLRHARGADAELTAWLDYRGAADVSPVRPAAPGAPDLGRLPGRLSSAAAADDNDTLGVGTYNVRHDQVEAEPVEVDFAHGAPVQRLEALARRDMDEGNMLLLDPHPVSGYSRPNAGEPRLQPMTRAAERFEPQRGDPDTGNVLLLRTSQDGVAHARSRPTAPNAPAAVFATTARDKAFLQPHEQVDLIGLRAMEMLSARRRRGIAGPPAVHQRISTAIMQVGTIGGGDLLHIIKEAGPASEVAQHIRRQERVIARMEAADK